MEENPYPKRDNAGNIVCWVLVAGEIELIFPTKEAALAALDLFLRPENEKILEFLEEGYIWEGRGKNQKEEILRALKKQNELFRLMLLALLGAEITWREGMAEQMIWQAVNFCIGLHHIIQPPAPADPPRG